MSEVNNSWNQPAGTWMIYEDGSMVRLLPLTEDDREFAKSKGIQLAPDHVPAEDVDKYPETRKFKK